MYQKNIHFPINYGIIYKDILKNIKPEGMDLGLDFAKEIVWRERCQQDITKTVRKFL